MRWVGTHGAAIHDLRICMHHEASGRADWERFQGGAVAVLSQMPNLQELEISGARSFFHPQHNLFIMEHLPKLKSLRLQVHSAGHWDESTLESLKHLTALTTLEMNIQDLGGPLLVSPELSTLTQLKNLELHASQRPLQVPGEADLMQAISQLTSLTRLSLIGMLTNVPPQLANLPKLASLALLKFPFGGPALSIPACLTLCSDLEHISLGHLSINSTSAGSWWGLCHSLQCLPSLASLSFAIIDLSRVPESAWTLPSCLTYLCLTSCEVASLPPAIRQLSSLESLTLLGSPIEKLDDGAYLKNLHQLCITPSDTGDGPEALAAAEHLVDVTVVVEDEHASDCGRWTKNALERIIPKSCSICFVDADLNTKEDDE